MTPGQNPPWWGDAVFYQIYPLSFADGNGDGYGDLEGVISRLDYVKDTLGADAIWLSPFYKSPMADWGYDVSDHTDVDPLFGDLDTAQRLIDEIHGRGMKVILDYVMNHTSDEHPWFIESRSSIDNRKRDWYVWRDPKPDGSPPNNWLSVFGGSMWTLDPNTGQYYRHSFLDHQPDLNWRNAEVVEAMHDVMRFWLDRGVDGFRVDVAHMAMKDPEERDNPPAPPDAENPLKDMGEYDTQLHIHDLGHPDIHGAHRQMRAILDEYGETTSVSEAHLWDLEEWASYYGSLDELHMPFNFHLMASPWAATDLKQTIQSVLDVVPPGAFVNWTMGNHDEKRVAARLGSIEDARLAALLLLTLPGAAFLYYGDELGMADPEVWTGEIRDPWAANVMPELNRDGCRTPMQWTSAPDAGFGSDESWLPLLEDHEENNVDAELADPESMLNLYRRIIEIRRDSQVLRRSSLTFQPASENVLVYHRHGGEEVFTIALNLSDQPAQVKIEGDPILSTQFADLMRRELPTGALGAREGMVYRAVGSLSRS